MIGGEGEDESMSAVLEYDPGDRSWKELPSMLTGRSYCAAAVLGGDVVVVGGRGSDDSDGSDVERYNQRSQCWEAMAALPTPLTHPAAVVVRV